MQNQFIIAPSWWEEEFEAKSRGYFVEICASKLNLNDQSQYGMSDMATKQK